MCLHYFKYSGARVERAGRSTRMMLTRCSIPTQSKVTKVFLLSQLLLTPDWVDSPHSTPSSHAAVKQTFTSQNDLLELVYGKKSEFDCSYTCVSYFEGPTFKRSCCCLLGSLVCSIKGLEGSAAVIWCKPECCAEVRRTTRAFCVQGPTKSLHTLTLKSDFLKWMLLN